MTLCHPAGLSERAVPRPLIIAPDSQGITFAGLSKAGVNM